MDDKRPLVVMIEQLIIEKIIGLIQDIDFCIFFIIAC
jgi:hypothetical protein